MKPVFSREAGLVRMSRSVRGQGTGSKRIHVCEDSGDGGGGDFYLTFHKGARRMSSVGGGYRGRGEERGAVEGGPLG